MTSDQTENRKTSSKEQIITCQELYLTIIKNCEEKKNWLQFFAKQCSVI